MGAKLGGSGGMNADINVAPMVDVMLVLLTIFMITAPMIQEDEEKRKVDMDLPVTRNNANRIDPKQTDKLILEIDDQLIVRIGEEVITDCSAASQKKNKDRFEVCFDDIEKKLATNVKLQEQGEIYLLADTDIPYGFVVGTMARIKRAGVNKVGMVTNPEYLDETPPAPTKGKK
ncbi:MAG: biopolymer transporter ExbD [bacterium]